MMHSFDCMRQFSVWQDKALADIDHEEKKSSSEYETDEEWEAERKKHLANEEKNTVGILYTLLFFPPVKWRLLSLRMKAVPELDYLD